ncbi:DUF4190 domain-containing protein [Arthrobacter sp. PM3]|uniref:DUF4190 domain-containing protein n=1 Tax=Arthrobacter sp. PM3 TaxID=2017685 RepID=UPI000E10C65C|nr:DUF4190 domain-containing protein [Arthrobacter sp. PM3]AXJ09533.1 hypothetical protein CFN17_07850 [Arthrobacter sp. PM3]
MTEQPKHGQDEQGPGAQGPGTHGTGAEAPGAEAPGAEAPGAQGAGEQGPGVTPEGYQPTLRLPDHEPAVPSQPDSSHPTTPLPDLTQQHSAGVQPGQETSGQEVKGQPTPDQGQYSSPYPPVYGAAGQAYNAPGQAPYGQQVQGYGQPSPYAQPYSYNAYGQPTYSTMPAAPKALSIASMCCGIAAWLGFGFFLLPQLAAVILGHLALRREPAGKGMAIAGLVLGYAAIAVTILVMVIFGLVIGTASNRGYGV